MKTNQEIAREVIRGKWGNGEERKQRLTKEGYSYKDIQSIVNVLMRDPKAVNEIKNEDKQEQFVITGTEILDVEIDLTKYKGINIIFKNGEEEKEEFDDSLLEGWE